MELPPQQSLLRTQSMDNSTIHTSCETDPIDTSESKPLPTWISKFFNTLSHSYNIPMDDLHDKFKDYESYLHVPFMNNDELRTFATSKGIKFKKVTSKQQLIQELLYSKPKTFTNMSIKRAFQNEHISTTFKRLDVVRTKLVLHDIPDTPFLLHEETNFVFNKDYEVIGKIQQSFASTSLVPLSLADIQLCQFYRFNIEAWTRLITSGGHSESPLLMKVIKTTDVHGVDHYIDTNTNYVILQGNIVGGKWINNQVVDLTEQDINWCRNKGVYFKLPIYSVMKSKIEQSGLELIQDIHGNQHIYDPITRFVVFENRFVVGKMSPDMTVIELSKEDIEVCKEHNIRFKLPVSLETPSTNSNIPIDVRIKNRTNELLDEMKLQ